MTDIVKALLLLAILLFLDSCHDSYSDLGNDYVYTNRVIAKVEKYNQYKTLDIVIWDQVLNYSYSEKYIIAYQIPDLGELWESCRGHHTETEKDSIDEQARLMNTIHHCFWIICKQSNKIFGPMKKSVFIEKCKEIGVDVQFDSNREKSFL